MRRIYRRQHQGGMQSLLRGSLRVAGDPVEFGPRPPDICFDLPDYGSDLAGVRDEQLGDKALSPGASVELQDRNRYDGEDDDDGERP